MSLAIWHNFVSNRLYKENEKDNEDYDDDYDDRSDNCCDFNIFGFGALWRGLRRCYFSKEDL